MLARAVLLLCFLPPRLFDVGPPRARVRGPAGSPPCPKCASRPRPRVTPRCAPLRRRLGPSASDPTLQLGLLELSSPARRPGSRSSCPRRPLQRSRRSSLLSDSIPTEGSLIPLPECIVPPAAPVRQRVSPPAPRGAGGPLLRLHLERRRPVPARRIPRRLDRRMSRLDPPPAVPGRLRHRRLPRRRHGDGGPRDLPRAPAAPPLPTVRCARSAQHPHVLGRRLGQRAQP